MGAGLIICHRKRLRGPTLEIDFAIPGGLAVRICECEIERRLPSFSAPQHRVGFRQYLALRRGSSRILDSTPSWGRTPTAPHARENEKAAIRDVR